MTVSVCQFAVCLFVCVFVCLRAHHLNYMPDRHQFLCVLPTAVARSSSGGVAICYALPVARMTTRLHIPVMARNKRCRKAKTQVTHQHPTGAECDINSYAFYRTVILPMTLNEPIGILS